MNENDANASNSFDCVNAWISFWNIRANQQYYAPFRSLHGINLEIYERSSFLHEQDY